jgi:ABC-type multidrug transport system fused ATPase/permease subunit
MKNFKKILSLFSPSEKKKLFFLLILILCMALIDMMGVASILPFIAVLANTQLIETNEVLKYLYQLSSIFGVTNSNQFIYVLGIAVFLFLIISLTFRALTNYAVIRFTLMREYTFGKRLTEYYLHQPYAWFLSRNSADLSKVILSGVNELVYETILPTLNLIAHSCVTMVLIIVLIIIDFKIALIISSVLTLSYGFIFYFTKNILYQIGSERLKANKKRFIALSESFGAIKEIKVGGLEKFYANRFSTPAELYANYQALSSVIAQLPKYFIEGVAFGGIVLLVLILIRGGNLFINIIPFIALYAFAGYRILPAIQQIYVALTQLRVSRSRLDSIHNDLMTLNFFEESRTKIKVMRLTRSIVLTNVHFDYPNSKQAAVKNINLSIPAFKKIGFIGATGSGKTTTVDLILGLLDPNKGTISIDGNVITNNNKNSWQKNIGYVPQQIYLIDDTVTANIAFGLNPQKIDSAAVENAAKIANLHDFVTKELPNNYNTILGERGIRFSGGQRQLLGIARALYHKPQVLILDEATSALDNLTEQRIMKAVNNLGKKVTIILIAHRLTTVKNCDIIFLLDKGELKGQGTYEELSRSSKLFEKMSKVN